MSQKTPLNVELFQYAIEGYMGRKPNDGNPSNNKHRAVFVYHISDESEKCKFEQFASKLRKWISEFNFDFTETSCEIVRYPDPRDGNLSLVVSLAPPKDS